MSGTPDEHSDPSHASSPASPAPVLRRSAPGEPDPRAASASAVDTDDDGVPAAERVTVRLPRQRPVPPRRPVRRAPVLVAATVTTVLGALLVWVPVVLLVLLATRLGGGTGLGFAGTARASLAVWLLAHGVPVYLGTAKVSLAPLALTLLAGWRVTRAGVHTARAIGARRRGAAGPVLGAALSVALVYALLGLLAGHLADHGATTVTPIAAALRMGVFGLLLGGAGAAVEGGLVARVRERCPVPLRDAVRTGVVAAGLVLGAGAGVAGVALAVHAGDASDVLSSYHAGVAGQAGLTLICLVYAPNLAVWSAAYLVGPGFAVGAGTAVSPASVSLGALPAVPVLVGLPTTSVSGFGVLLLGLPMAAGMVAGWLLVRRRLREAEAPLRWGGWTGGALLAGPVAGVLLGLAAVVSGGALGDGRLASMGPAGWEVGAVAAAVVALGALLGGVATHILMSPTRRR